jgi:hypothetical protein
MMPESHGFYERVAGAADSGRELVSSHRRLQWKEFGIEAEEITMRRVCLIALLTFSYCLTAVAQGQYGTVYLYRGRDTADYPPEINVLNPEAVVYLEGKEFLSMPERTFIGFKVPAGQYLLGMKRKGVRRVIDVEVNKTYYLRVSQVMYPNAYQIIYDVEEKSALEAIRRCDALKEKKVSHQPFESIRINPGKKKKA